VVRLRNSLYSKGLFTSKRLSRPVVSVGNITLGGAGKTPLTIYLAQRISESGFTPVVLSRGYGRASRGCSLLKPGDPVSSPAIRLGDEPALIRQRVPQAWLGIGSDRYSIGRRIVGQGKAIVFILDDGFQHRGLSRDLDIVVIDRTQAFEENSVFPRGSLREPLAALRRSSLIMINGFGPNGQPDPLEIQIKKIQPAARIFHCSQRLVSLVPFPEWRDGKCRAVPAHEIGSAFLVAAVGNPARFRADVHNFGVTVCGTRFFRDHSRLQADDWRACERDARRSGADTVIVTEKDAIKLPHAPDWRLLVAVQSIEVSEPDALDSILLSTLRTTK